LSYPRRNRRYTLPQMILALVYPLVLGLDRLETASFLRFNGTFQPELCTRSAFRSGVPLG